MHGNPVIHLSTLAIFSVILLPLCIAMLRGWAPGWVRRRLTPRSIRNRGAAVLLLYGSAAVNAVLRAMGASYEVVMAATVVGAACAVAGALFVAVSDVTEKRARRRAGNNTARP
ncbi:hypothetical protein [Streptomyces sp. 7N604]|uniref:hypothetical protein n=1 Tax=Streptomyces sp. 7N604 TaxID=3457415 RepID=UPI003FD13D42